MNSNVFFDIHDETLFNGSLLPMEAYLRDTEVELDNIFAQLMPDEDNKKEVIYPHILDVDMMVDSKRYKEIEKGPFSEHKAMVLTCFLEFINRQPAGDGYSMKRSEPFSRIELGDMLRYTYRQREYYVKRIVLNSFLYHTVWVTGDIDAVERDVNQMIMRDVPKYPYRGEKNDGQQKIMVDAILAVDAMEKKDNCKILVIGSSHEPGVVARSAYAPIFHMVENSEFHMYDPFEDSGETIEGTNLVKRFREPFVGYDVASYDLVLDDAWTELGTRVEQYIITHTKEQFYENFPNHYSLKIFKPYINARYYAQVGWTRSSELRLVSRYMIPSINHFVRRELGSCAFCRELVYNLQEEKYNDRFYEAIARCHKEPDGMRVNQFYSHSWESRVFEVEWKKIPKHGIDFYCLVGDIAYRHVDCLKVELRAEQIRGKVIKISSPVYLTILVAQEALRVIRDNDDNTYLEASPYYAPRWAYCKHPKKNTVVYFGNASVVHPPPDGSIRYDEWKCLPDKRVIAEKSTLLLFEKQDFLQLTLAATVWFRDIRCGEEYIERIYPHKTEMVSYLSKVAMERDRSSHDFYVATKMSKISRTMEQSYLNAKKAKAAGVDIKWDLSDFESFSKSVREEREARSNYVRRQNEKLKYKEKHQED